MDLQLAQDTLVRAWQADQHRVWELDWPAAPIGGLLTVETWRSAERYRFEILESTAPALIGQILIFDGQTAWWDNRFDQDLPQPASSPTLSPVSDAFAIIETLLTSSPIAATRQDDTLLNYGPTSKISLTFEDENTLSFWLESKTNLPVRIFFSVGDSQAVLHARQVEPLIDPPAGLFRPDHLSPRR